MGVNRKALGIARDEHLSDNSARRNPFMRNIAGLFQLLTEIIILLLGALLILLAITRPVRLPARPATLILLGLFLMYWGLRAWMRRKTGPGRWQDHIRGASLGLVGLLVVAIPIAPLRDAGMLLGTAGAVLILRGILASLSFAFARHS